MSFEASGDQSESLALSSPVPHSASTSSSSGPRLTNSGDYDDEDFEGYSDEFESDGDDLTGDNGEQRPTGTSDNAGPSNEASTRPELRASTHVQVFWEAEDEWFDGVISATEASMQKCFVHYDDGEQQWEAYDGIRIASPDNVPGQKLEQMQLLCRFGTRGQMGLTSTYQCLLGRRVSVYWDDEATWFAGTITALDGIRGAKITYDDGDIRWVAASEFSSVLVMPETLNRRNRSPSQLDSMPSSCTGNTFREITPRPYRQAVPEHFQPERVARPYINVVSSHSSSILLPRHTYSSRRYIHEQDKLECHSTTNDRDGTCRDCVTQTDIIGATSA